MKALADGEARRRIREDLTTTLVVEAAAGTGKTTELVGRIVSLVRSGLTTLGRIVAVTFTEKAAGEMKLRVREEIERARTLEGIPDAERERLDASLQELEVARITTIHAFAADLLRERPVEARIDPAFEVASEDVQGRLFDEAFDSWFQRVLGDPPEGIRRILRRRTSRRDDGGPRAALRAAAWSLAEHRDFDAAWRRDPFAREAAIDELIPRLEKVGGLAASAYREDDWLRKNLVEVQRFVEELGRRERARGSRDYDGLEAALRAFAHHKSWGWKGGGNWFGPKLPRQTVLAARDDVKAALDSLIARADADVAPCVERELRQMVASYEELKTRAGRLDFLDLLLRARDLILDHAEVRRELQDRFRHLLVDEFQDTDPLQAEILLLLAADDPAQVDWTQVRPVPGKLFIVGDPKQSIYSFRRADVALYDRVKRALLERGANVIFLTTSFRSVPSLQSAVNAAFAPEMRERNDSSQPEYVALEPFRDEQGDQPTVVALPVPRPYGDYGSVTNWAIERSLPDAVGAFVDWLVTESNWTVTERGAGARVPVEARHVCVLFRRFQGWEDVTRPYVRALEARRIPHVLVGGRSFYEREEVLSIRNALEAIERPSDELAVFATLRGPIVALPDESLLLFREQVGSLHPLRPVDASGLADPVRRVAEALALLRRLHLGRNRRPIADTIGRLLAETRAHAGIAIALTGEQALANVLRLMDLARRFEAAGATSFRAFVDWLGDESEAGAAPDAPIVEEGTEGVRIVTVHRAKGLEFPVVVLADPTARASRDKPSRHVDPDRRLWVEPICGCVPPELLEHWDDEVRRDAEEGVRVAYVAATRARDLLVVPVIGDEQRDGWLSVLSPAVHPEDGRRRHQRPAPECPAFGSDSVLERPEKAIKTSRDSVAPGLHQPTAGTHGVVWWDPAVLALGKEHEFGLRQQKLLEADDGGLTEEGVRAHTEWQARRTARLERGATPAILVTTATATRPAGLGAVRVTIESTAARRAGRPAGRRFGALVHSVLAAVDLKTAEADVLATAAVQGRALAAAPEEIAAAVEAVRGALAHPVLRRASAAAECHRETPVVVRLPDDSLAEGVLDLAFREGAMWTVVDFKTEADVQAHRVRYEDQVRLYASAVSAVTGADAECVLLAI